MSVEKEILIKLKKERNENKYLIYVYITYLYFGIKLNFVILILKYNWKKIGQDGSGPRRFFNLGRFKKIFSKFLRYIK